MTSLSWRVTVISIGYLPSDDFQWRTARGSVVYVHAGVMAAQADGSSQAIASYGRDPV